MNGATEGPVCRRCRASLEPGQEYCLECGARALLIRPRPAARWFGPSLVALLVAAAGGTIAIVGSKGSPARASQAIVATSRLEPAPPRPSPPPPGPVSNGSSQRLITWPSSSGYTLILATVPLSAGAQEAKQKALVALRRKLPDVGVLISTSYASLHPGYYVVFSGVYASREEAQADLLAARRYFASAYASPVVR